MAIAPAQLRAAPFDAIAEGYDETFTTSKVGQAQRTSVWKELRKVFNTGDRVLEIGSGTGVDACFLANRGVKVVACDSSSAMIGVATRRAAEEGMLNLVEHRLLPAESISTFPSSDPFDGAFSNFGVLNCVEDLRQFARDLAILLKPGATALLCLMGPCCLWEVAWYLVHGNTGKAFRRFNRGGVLARLADGATLHVQYPSLRSLASTFAPEFRLVSVNGVGVTVPPSYLESLAWRFPRLFEIAVRTDSVLGRCPGIRECADHVLLRFRRDGPAA